MLLLNRFLAWCSIWRLVMLCLLSSVGRFQILAASPEFRALASAEDLYAVENLLKIEFFLEPAAWDKVRFAKREEKKVEKNGKTEVEILEYVSQRGDVVINGKRMTNVHIRKKGFVGSLSAQRPSLKIRLDGQAKGQDGLGLEELTLNNNVQDPTQIRQYLAYKWFARAGIPASRCNFARVSVNGKYLGIYSNVEPVGKTFLQRQFGNAQGTLYEGTGADFQTRSLNGFERKMNKAPDDKQPLKEVAKLFAADGKVALDELAKRVDLDQFLKFWGAEVLLGHWDGYAGNRNNFFVYLDPKSHRFQFLPWGTDGTFSEHLFIKEHAPKIIKAQGRLCSALYQDPAYRQRYLKLLAGQLDDWWQEQDLLEEADRAAKLLRPHLHVSDEEFDSAFDALKTYIKGVAPQVRGELKDPPEKWVVAVPSASTSAEENPGPAGRVTSKFVIPLEVFVPAKALPSAQIAMEIQWHGKPVQLLQTVGVAGYKSTAPRWYESPEVAVSGVLDQKGRAIFIYLKLDPELLAKTGEFKLDMFDAMAWFGSAAPARGFTIHGSLSGTAHCKVLERDGKRLLEGTVDAAIHSGDRTLEF